MTLVSTPATAGGFAQGFQGAPSAGVSGAVTGRPDVPEAGYYNPAGWTLQDEWGLGAGSSALFPSIYHEGQAGQRTQAEVDGAFPPYLHAFGQFGDFAAGVPAGIPYGATVQWPEEWRGRFEATSTSFRTMEVAPSVAWRPIDELAIGAGPRLVRSDLGFERALDFAQEDQEGTVELDADAYGVGGQVGIWGRVHDAWTIGGSWRSAIDLDMEGMARFEDVPREMERSAYDTRARTEMVLPHRFALGVAYELAVSGIISVDIEYTRWGVYETFDVEFESGDIDQISEERDWGNTIAMRAGAEYMAPVDGLVIRSGLALEPSPAPEEAVTAAQPDTDRTVTSLGIGYEPVAGVAFDVAYNFVILSQTPGADDGFSGAYGGHIHAFTAGLHVRPFTD